MELSRIKLYPAPDGAEFLYNRGGRADDGVIYLAKGESADFATYFGCLDAQVLLEKTNVRKVSLRLFFDGLAQITLSRYIPYDEPAIDGEKKYHSYVISEIEAEGSYRTEVEVYGGGLLGFRITSIDKVTFYGGVWECDDASVNQAVSMGIIIPILQEGDDRNVVPLTRVKHEINGLDVYVVDCTQSLTEKDLPDGIKLIRCRNLGEVGAVTRGLIECNSDKKTHALIMRGGVCVDPSVIGRITAFSSVLNAENLSTAFGCVSFLPETPTKTLRVGKTASEVLGRDLGANIDASTMGGLLATCLRNVDYCDWDCFCFPLSAQKMAGLPLPTHTEGSQEWGMRLSEFSSVIIPAGFGVWTKPYERRGYEYYLYRNACFAYASLGGVSGKPLRKMLKKAFRKYVHKDKEKLAYVFDGVEDFLKGVNFLHTLASDKLDKEIQVGPRKQRGYFASLFHKIALSSKLRKSRKLNKQFAQYRAEIITAKNWSIRLGIELEEQREK